MSIICDIKLLLELGIYGLFKLTSFNTLTDGPRLVRVVSLN